MSSMPRGINYWGAQNNVQWHDTRVEHSDNLHGTHGYYLAYRPDDPPYSPTGVASWRDHENIKSSSASRPSSSSSVTSFKSSSSSRQSAVVLTDAQLERTLLKIPYDLVLCLDYLHDYAKGDETWYKVLLWMEAHGAALKYKITAFLCMVWVQSMNNVAPPIPHPWLEYVKWLPRMPIGGEVLPAGSTAPLTVPIAWPVSEQQYLAGTSLEHPLRAKFRSLQSKFQEFRDFAEEAIADGHHDLVWIRQVNLADWVRFDACFHSRSLATPDSGICMVPCLDMANHSDNPNAHFLQDSENGDIMLFQDKEISVGDEITINYAPEHGAGETLMTYGFIDPNMTYNPQLTLLIPDQMPGDVYAPWVDRYMAFRSRGLHNLLTIRVNGELECAWESPFAHFLAINAGDGQLSIDTDENSRPCGVRWEGVDIWDMLDKFEEIIADHPNNRAIRLRVVNLVMKRLRLQRQRLINALEITDELARSNPNIAMCRRLRELEMVSLLGILGELMKQANGLRPDHHSSESSGDIETSFSAMGLSDD